MERFSMNEFQPLSLAEKKQRLENKIAEIEKDKHPFVIRKQEIEAQLSEYNSVVRSGESNNVEYVDLCKKQKGLIKEKSGIDLHLMELKRKLRQINNEKDNLDLQIKRLPNDKAKQIILDIREKYISFAADTTRVSSMRAMASRFVEEIQKILNEMEP